MIKEASGRAVDIRDNREVRKIYGYSEEVENVLKAGIEKKGVKEMYNLLMEKSYTK